MIPRSRWSAGIALGFVIAAIAAPSSSWKESRGFAWKKITPRAELVWQTCYDGLDCARLNVPLNHSDPNGSQIAIAITRIKSIFPVDSPLYRGPILVNPGGPGGSGVDWVLTAGRHLSTIVGPQFDIVGFDPRGIARSTPRVSFFEPIERAAWGFTVGAVHVLNASADGVAREWARAMVTNRIAGMRQAGLLRHINTDQTARDMLRIVEAYGRDKLQYWGFSYGSVLGSTFAAMFPDKVERMVIDGVVDVEDYYETLWSHNLLDADRAMQHFFSSCHSAGPLSCPFYAPTPSAISQNLSSLYTAILRRPVPVVLSQSSTSTGAETSYYGIVDYNRLKTTVFTSLYAPYATFRRLSEALTDLAEGRGERLFEMLAFLPGANPRCHCDCDEGGGDSGEEDVDIEMLSFTDGVSAVACNDGAEVSSRFGDFEKYFEEMTRGSEWGELWAAIRALCIGWPKFPKTHFRGPVAGNTHFPILLIGNTADPATPIHGAKKVSKSFPGSIVLTQDGPGHCSIAAPSPCTMNHIRKYFIDGNLPLPGTICPVLGSPFFVPALGQVRVQDDEEQGYSLESTVVDDEDENEEELVEAGYALSSMMVMRRVGLPLLPL